MVAPQRIEIKLFNQRILQKISALFCL